MINQSGTQDVIVIGAGIIGVALAWELSKSGRQVTLVDREGPGMGCSWGNAAHFATEQIFPLANGDNLKNLPGYLFRANSPLTFRKSSLGSLIPWGVRYLLACRESQVRRGAAALRALNERSLSAWQDLLADVGAASLLHTPGTLQLAETRQGALELEALQRDLSVYGIASTLLNSGEVTELIGALAPGDYRGLHFPGTAYCNDPYELLLAVFRACLARQVRFCQADVRHLRAVGDGSVEVETEGGTLTAGAVVICCGVHSKALIERQGYHIPMIAERGYHMLLPEAGICPSLPITLHERQFIMTPMNKGVRLAGTVEFARPEDPPTMKRADMLFDQASQLFPSLNASDATKWMGCRPTLPDYLPVIGRLSRAAGQVFASFGHAHLGLTQAAISARMLAMLMEGDEPGLDLHPYRVERF
tara:strand:- start:26670 stop:27926 length:1257 start_codon:yes stop_codon:yes gene_type:complete